MIKPVLHRTSERQIPARFGYFFIYGLVGVIGTTAFLKIIKQVITLGSTDPFLDISFLACVLTILATLLGDVPRRMIGVLYLISLFSGLIGMILGYGLEFQEIANVSTEVFTLSLMAAFVVFLPDWGRTQSN